MIAVMMMVKMQIIAFVIASIFFIIYNIMENLVIKPIKTREYEVPESRYKQVGKLPFRTIILGSSGSGKKQYCSKT